MPQDFSYDITVTFVFLTLVSWINMWYEVMGKYALFMVVMVL